jgi:hypothetical protein
MTGSKQRVGGKTKSSSDSGTIAGGYLVDARTGRCILVSRRTALRITRFLQATANGREHPKR